MIQKAYIIGLIFILLFAGCGGSKNESPVKREIISGVKVTKLNPVQVDVYYEASGTVPATTASIVAGEQGYGNSNVRKGERGRQSNCRRYPHDH